MGECRVPRTFRRRSLWRSRGRIDPQGRCVCILWLEIIALHCARASWRICRSRILPLCTPSISDAEWELLRTYVPLYTIPTLLPTFLEGGGIDVSHIFICPQLRSLDTSLCARQLALISFNFVSGCFFIMSVRIWTPCWALRDRRPERLEGPEASRLEIGRRRIADAVSPLHVRTATYTGPKRSSRCSLQQSICVCSSGQQSP